MVSPLEFQGQARTRPLDQDGVFRYSSGYSRGLDESADLGKRTLYPYVEHEPELGNGARYSPILNAKPCGLTIRKTIEDTVLFLNAQTTTLNSFFRDQNVLIEQASETKMNATTLRAIWLLLYFCK